MNPRPAAIPGRPSEGTASSAGSSTTPRQLPVGAQGGVGGANIGLRVQDLRFRVQHIGLRV